jgi:two-component sensor histidine kinase
MNFASEDKPEKPRPPLSERVALMQQLVPFTLLVVVVGYELTQHLLFPNAGHPVLFAIEMLVFGIIGPMAVWLTLHWIQGEIRAREAAQGELDLRTRMMLEMHHRIRNNLQTIADLLSLEMTRANGRSSAESLRDSVARIKSIAAAHEMLSPDQIGGTDITELAQRVADSARSAQMRAEQTIHVAVEGPKIFLPSKSATAFALVINELVSNALEHGLATRAQGAIDITLEPDDGQVRVRVQDDGVGLKSGFELAQDAGLGLRIVRTLVEKDLHGSLQLLNDVGTCAEFTFPINEGTI